MGLDILGPLGVTIFSSILSLVFAGGLIFYVLKKREGNEKMKKISMAIREGAEAYLKTQFKAMSIFIVILTVVLYFVINWQTALSFLAGSLLSYLAGYIGMSVSVRTNVRVAEAAKKGMKEAFKLAVRGGAVTGFCVVGLALLGVASFYYIFQNPNLIVGFAFGASLVSLFARIGGGIYTKAADIGADLVGKVEKNIPEDDPRNPAVIADLVGDNVGDCAGMAADLFETYAVTLIGAMLLGYLISGSANYVLYPLLIGAVGIFASILGVLSVTFRGGIMKSLYLSLAVTILISLIGFYFVTKGFIDFKLFYADVTGVLVGVGLFAITEYYTSKKFRPVKEIAKSSKAGPALTILSGFSKSLESTIWPTLLITVATLIAYHFGGIYGIGVATTAMLSITGMIITLDSYGPITDNASGIAEMSGLPSRIRKITDALDAVGNTTKAVTKAFAIGSAALAALTLFAAFQQEVRLPLEAFTIGDPKVLVGVFVGAAVPFLFSSFCLKSASSSAFLVVEEVRRQFREIKGLLKGKAKPLYGRCVEITTKAGIRGMKLPVLLALISPLAVGFILGPKALGGFLLGSIATGFLLAIQMATGGASWDNAKKFIEEGNYGGKGSEAHKAAVVGDTVGDPMKDTAAPAINPLIKVINTVSILFASLIVAYALL